jgi:hypothetical protein
MIRRKEKGSLDGTKDSYTLENGIKVKSMELECGLLRMETATWANGSRELLRVMEFISVKMGKSMRVASKIF